MLLNCFTPYDVRGRVGKEIDTNICYRIGRAFVEVINADKIVIGYDARRSSPEFADAVSIGAMDAGADILSIGLCGTEEVYWAVNNFRACGGIMVTGSHNPILYNGLKFVKNNARPLDPILEFQKVKSLAEKNKFYKNSDTNQIIKLHREARIEYVKKILSFVDDTQFKPMTIVVNSGNGAAGPTFDAIVEAMNSQVTSLKFIRLNHKPDPRFPNGIPNPLLEKNNSYISKVIVKEKAHFGVAFDGDFDRCFVFDNKGMLVPGENIVCLLASILLKKEKGAKIVHDPRLIWTIQSTIKKFGGRAVQSKAGHIYFKHTMRRTNAIYGGEISSHHYFRDFSYCDSGMVPWLMVLDHISKSNKHLSELISENQTTFKSSKELNFQVADPDAVISDVVAAFESTAIDKDFTDGVSLTFPFWRFNIRKSNTEPVVRLNIETYKDQDLIEEKISEIKKLLF